MKTDGKTPETNLTDGCTFHFFRSWKDKSKCRTAAQAAALRHIKSGTEILLEAAATFFEKFMASKPACYSPYVSLDGTHSSDDSFTLAERQDALDHSL